LTILVLAHASGLDNGFHYDDGHSILRNPHIRSLDNLPTFFTNPHTFSENPDYAMYRPLVLVAHALNYAWSEYRPWGYQLLNLFFHILASLLVFALLRQLRLPPSAALLGALLFGLHPAQTENINYISSRSESMAALFYLGAFFCYLRAFPASTAPSWSWYGLSLLSFGLGLLCKAIALTLPLTLLFYAFLHNQQARVYKLHLPYWLLGGVYLLLYHNLAAQGFERSGQVRDLTTQLATQSKAFVHYLKLAFVPTTLNVHQQFFTSSSFLEPAALLGLLAGCSVIGLIYFLRCRARLLAFGLGWFLLILLPTFLVPLHILVNDHRLYLALFGLALVLGQLAKYLKPRWALYLVCLVAGMLSFQRHAVWKNELTLWQDAVIRAPLMPEAHYNLGYAHHQAGDMARARQAYEQAVHLSPAYARAQTNLGAIYRQEGQTQQAIQAFQSALQAAPETVEALNNLGLIYTAQKHFDEAIALFQQALRLQPELAEVWMNLGLAYRDQGQREQAVQALSRAIQLKPALKKQFPVGN
jgi:Flp pilus assembly protein TadD